MCFVSIVGPRPTSFSFSRRVPRLAAAAIAGVLALPVAGCFLPNETMPAAIDRSRRLCAGPRNADAALPPLDWWRGFRSGELTELVEEALTANFDIAAAVARIVQADAQSAIAGAALLPTSTSTAARRARARRRRTAAAAAVAGGVRARRLYSASLNASYEIDFWGKNRAALRAAEETRRRQPLRPRGGRR